MLKIIIRTNTLNCSVNIKLTEDLSSYSQLVSLRKPDTLKNLTCRTFDMNGDIPPCAPFNKLIIY